jgi:cell division protein FtsQ
MKRPDGFDPRTPDTPDSSARGFRDTGVPGHPAKARQHKTATGAPSDEEAPRSQKAPKPNKERTASRLPRVRRESKSERNSHNERDPGAFIGIEPSADLSRQADARAKRASRQRRRFERSEVRRFTKRSRHRKFAWLSVGAAFVVLCLLVAVAVFSPLLSLKTITIEGASSVSAVEIRSALKKQIGTPLALVDFGQIKTELARFPLIRSYVTETVPPNTLVIHIVERAPLGVVATALDFVVVDAAGVTLAHEVERPAKLPIIDSGSTATNSAAFKAAVSVLLALPASVSSRVDTVTARTKDDVTLVLDGAGQRVVWGSAERSAVKARVLADLISHQDPNAAVEYDVSAPKSAVVRSK